jgi:hypothetical protein
MRGFFMAMSKICPALTISAGLLLGGCTSIKQYLSPAETGAADAEQAEAAAPEAESPPIEVRRQAKADCVSEGYEVAVVETLVLDGNVATAHFICRGDFE